MEASARQQTTIGSTEKNSSNNKRLSAVSQMAAFHNIYNNQATVAIALLVSVCLRHLNPAACNDNNNKTLTVFTFGGFLRW